MSTARRLWIRARLYAAIASSSRRPIAQLDSNKKTIVIGLAADYGNLGDLAITAAQVEFLTRRFPEAQIVPIPISCSAGELRAWSKQLGRDDLVTLIGGGNFGDRYDDIQFLRDQFLRYMRHVPTIAFPQSVEFSDSMYGRLAESRARAAINGHSRLALMARDEASSARMERLSSSDAVFLAPDVVLTLDRTEPVASRPRGILLGLRNDSESALTSSERQMVIQVANEFGDVLERDTHVGAVRVNNERAGELLDSIWSDYRGAALVVTDRLHGVIFSVITGRPCIAIDNSIGKVRRFVTDWLGDVTSCVMLHDVDEGELRYAARNLHKMSAHKYGDSARHALALRFASSFESALRLVTG